MGSGHSDLIILLFSFSFFFFFLKMCTGLKKKNESKRNKHTQKI